MCLKCLKLINDDIFIRLIYTITLIDLNFQGSDLLIEAFNFVDIQVGRFFYGCIMQLMCE